MNYLVVFKEVDFLKELLSVSFGPKLTTCAKHNKRMVKNNISCFFVQLKVSKIVITMTQR